MDTLGKTVLTGVAVITITYALLAYSKNAASETKTFAGAWGNMAKVFRG